MKPAEDLFELIKSLTKSEKRYFKLFSSMQKGDKFYLKLFDAIERQTCLPPKKKSNSGQEKYDEKQVLLDLNVKGSAGWFSTAKHRLYHLLLRSMENYHSSSFSEVKSNMHRADFLYHKGLYKQSEKIIEWAKKKPP